MLFVQASAAKLSVPVGLGKKGPSPSLSPSNPPTRLPSPSPLTLDLPIASSSTRSPRSPSMTSSPAASSAPEKKELSDLFSLQGLSEEGQSSALARYSKRISQINSTYNKPKIKFFFPQCNMPTLNLKLTHEEQRKQAHEMFSLKALHQQLLEWDINNLDQVRHDMQQQFKRVPAQFRNEDEYMHTFFPLLLEEARAVVETALEESLAAQEILYPKHGGIQNGNDLNKGKDEDNSKFNRGVVEIVSVCSYSQINQFAHLQLVRSQASMVANVGVDDLVLLWRKENCSKIAAGEWQMTDLCTLACVEKLAVSSSEAASVVQDIVRSATNAALLGKRVGVCVSYQSCCF